MAHSEIRTAGYTVEVAGLKLKALNHLNIGLSVHAPQNTCITATAPNSRQLAESYIQVCRFETTATSTAL